MKTITNDKYFLWTIGAVLAITLLMVPHIGAPICIALITTYLIRKYRDRLSKRAIIAYLAIACILTIWVYMTGHPAQRTLRKYLKATSAEERAKYVRSPEKVLPLMRERYKDLSGGAKYLRIGRPQKVGNWVFINVLFSIRHNTEYSMEYIDGHYKIDWETSVVYNPMSFRELIAEMPTSPHKFRVRAQLSEHYNYEFMNAIHSHYSIELRESGTDKTIYGYVEKNTIDGEGLYEVLKGGGWQPVIIELQYLPRSESNQHVLVTKFIQKFFNEY